MFVTTWVLLAVVKEAETIRIASSLMLYSLDFGLQILALNWIELDLILYLAEKIRQYRYTQFTLLTLICTSN